MLLTIGIASLASLRSAERARLMFAMNITYGIGVVAAGAMNAWFGKPLPLGYIFGLALIAIASAAALSSLPSDGLRPSEDDSRADR